MHVQTRTGLVLYLVSVSTTSSSSSSSHSSDIDEPIYEEVKSSRARLPSPAQTVPHANTLPMTSKQMKSKRRTSSSSSSSSNSAKPSRMRRAQTLTETSWSPTILQNLNRNYQPVYKLRKVSSMTQTDYKEANETAA